MLHLSYCITILETSDHTVYQSIVSRIQAVQNCPWQSTLKFCCIQKNQSTVLPVHNY